MLSLPAIGGQAIDPIVLLLETAYIGRLGNLHILTYCFVSYYFTYSMFSSSKLCNKEVQHSIFDTPGGACILLLRVIQSSFLLFGWIVEGRELKCTTRYGKPSNSPFVVFIL